MREAYILQSTTTGLYYNETKEWAKERKDAKIYRSKHEFDGFGYTPYLKEEDFPLELITLYVLK